MNSIFQGDPKITVDGDGADLHFTGGQCVMDQGLENASFISISTTEDWFGNVLFQDPEQQINESKYLTALNNSITRSTLNDARAGAEKDLQWEINSGLASEINVDVSNNVGYNVQSIIQIIPPGRDTEELQATKNGNNWIFQKLNPAHERV